MSRASESTAEAVSQAADRVREKAAEVSHHLKEVAEEKYDQVRKEAAHVYNEGRHKAEQWEESLESYVQEKPLQAVLLAAGVGLLLGLLWKRH